MKKDNDKAFVIFVRVCFVLFFLFLLPFISFAFLSIFCGAWFHLNMGAPWGTGWTNENANLYGIVIIAIVLFAFLSVIIRLLYLILRELQKQNKKDD